jgi:hypothetical protein
MKQGSASDAAQSMLQTNTHVANTAKFARIKKITIDGIEDVYNMEVDKNHNFAVNGGYIVHNCMDAIRYLCYTLHITKKHAEYTASLD